MELKLGTKLHGFVVHSAQELPEIKATLYRMEYEKNGADLIWLDRTDDNKTFAITFKTIPQDDTGVFHILEHSVFNGSDKYPVKEPFVELLKSSLQTFLNAMTYPDKTMYPVSSRNGQDFLNLMDAYLDAVFHPLCVKDPHAFRQEGWHYELESPQSELTCNGVVLNEMKGAYADPDTLVQTEIMALLFPDNCYRFESGGHPDHIPELTYESYKASHARFYHPSNSRIVLDGTVDLDAALAKLDSFLSAFDPMVPDADIPMQAPVSPEERTDYYEIGPGEDGTDQVILAGGWVYGTFDEREKSIACGVLSQILCGSNEAPLKKALLESGLAQNVGLSSMDGLQQSYVVLEVRNTSLDKKQQVWQTVEGVLRELADKGLDHDRLHAILNWHEFSARERDFGETPRGLVFTQAMLSSWLYGGDPAQNLCYDSIFRSLREKIEQGWFESFLREVFLDNPHRAKLCLLPSTTVGEEKRCAEQARLAAVKAGWSQESIQQVMEQFQALRERQEQAETPEQLACLPMLSLSDIPEEGPVLRQAVETLEGVTLLHQDVETDGIIYLDLHFDLSDLDVDDLCKLPLLSRLLGQLATKHYTALELRNRIEGSLGHFAVGPSVYAKAKQYETCTPVMSVGVALLEGRKTDARQLLAEVLHTTRLDDAYRVCSVLRQGRIGMEQAVISQGNSFASKRVMACWSARLMASEALSGIRQLRWLQTAERKFADGGSSLCGELAALCEKIFVRERVTLSVIGPVDEAWLKDILSDLPSGEMGQPAEYPIRKKASEGLLIPAEIGFTARGGILKDLGDSLVGVGQVAANILTYNYLWNEVRVKGGAYGTGLQVGEDGLAAFTSYRDPRCGRSLDIYTNAGAALRAFCDSGETLDKYIISTIGGLDPLLTPRAESQIAAFMHFSGRTQADRQRIRSGVLHTTADDLHTFSQALDQLCAGSTVCVVGGQTALDSCGDRLEHRESLQ